MSTIKAKIVKPGNRALLYHSVNHVPFVMLQNYFKPMRVTPASLKRLMRFAPIETGTDTNGLWFAFATRKSTVYEKRNIEIDLLVNLESNRATFTRWVLPSYEFRTTTHMVKGADYKRLEKVIRNMGGCRFYFQQGKRFIKIEQDEPTLKGHLLYDAFKGKAK